MKRLTVILLLADLAAPVLAQEPLALGNDPWPPFIIEGEEAGTAEALVCEALSRSGRGCSIEVGDWQETLAAARAGRLDGIAALWKTPQREEYLVYSQPYLTNRIVAVTRSDSGLDINGVAGLAGHSVALEAGAAYGDEIESAMPEFEAVSVRSVEDALRAVRDGQAEVALVDELIARGFAASGDGEALEIGDAALSFRELHFGMSRKHPQAEEIIAAFNRSFEAMLQDGTVNEILNVNWLVTDLGRDGDLDFVLRAAVGPEALADPSLGGAYAHGQRDFDSLSRGQSGASYQVNGVEHDSLAAALDAAYGKRKVCGYDAWSSHIICTEQRKR